MKNVFFVIAIFYAINLNSQTDLNYYFGNTNNFNESIPKPSEVIGHEVGEWHITCLLYTSPSPRDKSSSRMPSSA